MSLVLDGSVTVSWYFEDERTEATESVLDFVVEHGAVAPPLWRHEFANALTTAMRRNRIDKAFRDASLTDLAALPVSIDGEAEAYVWSDTLRLADQYRLTVYDAVYLELARRRALPLATLDKALRAAARACSVELTIS